MTVWFSSDLHLNHFNIIKHCNRPFSSAQEMTEKIISNFNSVIQTNDTLYHLGDFAWKTSDNYLSNLISRFNGKKIFIIGNHDNKNQIIRLCSSGIISSYHCCLGTTINNQYMWLSHYPHRSWDKSFHGSIHLFGHVHGRFSKYGRSMDVGVDSNNFFPYSAESIIDILLKENSICQEEKH